MAKEYPDIAVFDLDYTIWPTHADTNISVPYYLNLILKTAHLVEYIHGFILTKSYFLMFWNFLKIFKTTVLLYYLTHREHGHQR